ncbi:RpoE-regulated lipoprotein [Mixta tenebrionis]|uniref:RpoE-regulated lipoprotein n=1 Tax=Mixta tenebrionis TaxID=2562439 RepID=A0A506VB78_9GAMM|nr:MULTISPECIES: RpoE-regulated lipoprotein [Mixta]QHM74645.1 hypothetical protein C7M52_00581 [Mixta theicola]TPW42253.1 RpoE-regulated lipoprotein [Mixta tenebrionis]
MKSVRSAFIVAALLLVSCASSGSHRSETSWWNPLDWSWSTLWPGNWFGSALTVTEQGVGAVNGSTPLQANAINEALNGDYRLRQGMRSEQGGVVNFWQALKDDEVSLTLSGKESVSRIEVSDVEIASADGTHIGDAFSKRYQKAFGHCQPVANEASVLCQAPNSQHISYLYQGQWAGPLGLIPPDDILQSWRVSKIIWQR